MDVRVTQHLLDVLLNFDRCCFRGNLRHDTELSRKTAARLCRLAGGAQRRAKPQVMLATATRQDCKLHSSAGGDAFGEVPQDVANRDNADQLALEQNRDVAIAADVHLVQSERDLVVGFERDRAARS